MRDALDLEPLAAVLPDPALLRLEPSTSLHALHALSRTGYELRRRLAGKPGLAGTACSCARRSASSASSFQRREPHGTALRPPPGRPRRPARRNGRRCSRQWTADEAFLSSLRRRPLRSGRLVLRPAGSVFATPIRVACSATTWATAGVIRRTASEEQRTACGSRWFSRQVISPEFKFSRIRPLERRLGPGGYRQPSGALPERMDTAARRRGARHPCSPPA
jgi:hypothetical protein